MKLGAYPKIAEIKGRSFPWLWRVINQIGCIAEWYHYNGWLTHRGVMGLEMCSTNKHLCVIQYTTLSWVVAMPPQSFRLRPRRFWIQIIFPNLLSHCTFCSAKWPETLKSEVKGHKMGHGFPTRLHSCVCCQGVILTVIWGFEPKITDSAAIRLIRWDPIAHKGYWCFPTKTFAFLLHPSQIQNSCKLLLNSWGFGVFLSEFPMLVLKRVDRLSC